MRVFEPQQLTVLTTSKCTAACRHCCMHSSPERDDMLTWEQLHSILTQAFSELKLKVVIFAGGEPMLLKEDLYKAFRLCKENGLMTRMVTNAYWATSPRVALMKCKELRAAGLDELNISTDDYHLDYIKLQFVKNAYEAALTLDFSAVVIANCYGPESTLTPERIQKEFGKGDMQLRFDEEGNAIENHCQKDKTLVVLSNARVQRLGRGLTEMRESELPVENELDKLSKAIGGCPWAIRSAAISAKGHFVSCCGFEVEDNPILDYGDLNKHSLRTLMDRADNDLISNLIAVLGPVKMMQLLREICPDEVSFTKTYRSYCEVCSDLVTIRKNRDALYKHSGAFADLMLQVREVIKQRYTLPDGRVELPAQQMVTIADKSREGPSAGP